MMMDEKVDEAAGSDHDLEAGGNVPGTTDTLTDGRPETALPADDVQADLDGDEASYQLATAYHRRNALRAGLICLREFRSDTEPTAAASPAAAASSYEPTIYQRPHPNDRDRGPLAASKASCKSKDDKAGSRRRCAKCNAPGATKVCGRCRETFYCGRSCQTAHHKIHKKVMRCKMRWTKRFATP